MARKLTSRVTVFKMRAQWPSKSQFWAHSQWVLFIHLTLELHRWMAKFTQASPKWFQIRDTWALHHLLLKWPEIYLTEFPILILMALLRRHHYSVIRIMDTNLRFHLITCCHSASHPTWAPTKFHHTSLRAMETRSSIRAVISSIRMSRLLRQRFICIAAALLMESSHIRTFVRRLKMELVANKLCISLLCFQVNSTYSIPMLATAQPNPSSKDQYLWCSLRPKSQTRIQQLAAWPTSIAKVKIIMKWISKWDSTREPKMSRMSLSLMSIRSGSPNHKWIISPALIMVARRPMQGATRNDLVWEVRGRWCQEHPETRTLTKPKTSWTKPWLKLIRVKIGSWIHFTIEGAQLFPPLLPTTSSAISLSITSILIKWHSQLIISSRRWWTCRW